MRRLFACGGQWGWLFGRSSEGVINGPVTKPRPVFVKDKDELRGLEGLALGPRPRGSRSVGYVPWCRPTPPARHSSPKAPPTWCRAATRRQSKTGQSGDPSVSRSRCGPRNPVARHPAAAHDSPASARTRLPSGVPPRPDRSPPHVPRVAPCRAARCHRLPEVSLRARPVPAGGKSA